MTTYTLFELLDLAIGTPEIGAVNFNVLGLLLKKILKASRIGERTVRYRYVDPTTLMQKILQEKGEISLSEQGEIDEGLADIENEESYVEKTTNTDSQIWPVPELQELFTSVQYLDSKLDKVKLNLKSLERQIKLMKKKGHGEGQKRDGESGFDLDGEPFQEAIEEMQESIAVLANKLRVLEESSSGSSQEEAINKLCEKAAEEQIAKRQGDFNDRLKSLALTVGNLQHVVKEILYPQAAGVTKCVTCGRKARLPNLDLLSGIKDNKSGDKNLQDLIRPKPAKRKENQKKHELKFTLLSLDNIKKAANLPASKVLPQIQKQPLSSDARMESQNVVDEEKRQDDIFNTEHATSAFMPLRLIPDPSRSGPLLADALYINPGVMTISAFGINKTHKY